MGEKMSRKIRDSGMEEEEGSGGERAKHDGAGDGGSNIKGTVVLMKKNVLNFNDITASVVDRLDEFFGNKVSLNLISAVNGDPEKGFQGKVGKEAYLEDWITKSLSLKATDMTFSVTFDWEEEIGVPGAFIITNHHRNEFYIKTLTLEHVPGHGRIHFICNSWVYPAECYKKDRIFFTNQTFLPSHTPAPLRHYREEELESLRGNGTGRLQEWDRVYDYDIYNDLGDPDSGEEHFRPILGGSKQYPYPRRGRTGRPPANKDLRFEGKLPLHESFKIYVPRDERFSYRKLSYFSANALKAIFQNLMPGFESLFDRTPHEFDTFEDVLKLYEGGIGLSTGSLKNNIRNHIPVEMKEFLQMDSERQFKFPLPQVIKEDKTAWSTDEEFAREMLAGVNPVVIRRLQEFPPTSKLDPKVYGNQTSSMDKVKPDIESNLEALTIVMAVKDGRLFILDHHDTVMPYLRGINSTSTKIYASRTLLFLKMDGTLKPVAIELSLPHPQGNQFGAVSTVYMPAEQGVEGTLWKLAKAYVAVNDSGHHQLISHWLHTHATIEPFVIATNRQLSVLHPIFKLLHPHFRDTMNVNALARQTLINAGGMLERTVYTRKFSLEMSAYSYKEWDFPGQALPEELIKRGMAVKDPNARHGLRLLVEDYPYAVDGLEIWAAIKEWVENYCSFYYKDDSMVQDDNELQSWWTEIRERGHGDKKDKPWWPKMQNVKDLIDACTIIVWTASALHAAVNFGQYPYGGYLPNRPGMSRRFMPEMGTPEFKELESDPEKALLKTITAQLPSIVGISLVELLSMHSPDEVFLGKRESPEWTADEEPIRAFNEFGEKLRQIEGRIIKMNNDSRWKNRVGPVKMPYTLLYPSSETGLTGKGIPNSISI